MICRVEDGRDSVCFCHSSSDVISIRVDILILFSVCSGVDVAGGGLFRSFVQKIEGCIEWLLYGLRRGGRC